MSKITIYLDGGASIDLDVEKFAVVKNALGGIHSMEWVGARPNILRLNIDKVSAVVEHIETEEQN